MKLDFQLCFEVNRNEMKKYLTSYRNYGLLSFGDEAEDDEDELETATKTLKPKAKSAHDIGDPTLLAKPNNDESKSGSSTSDESSTDDEKKPKTVESKEKVNIDSIKSKLSKSSVKDQLVKPKSHTDSSKSENDKEEKRFFLLKFYQLRILYT